MSRKSVHFKVYESFGVLMSGVARARMTLMRRAAVGFWAAAAAAALVVAILLLRDPRTTTDDERWLIAAVVVAVASGVRAIVHPRRAIVADLSTAAALVTIAVATHRIGGLAFLLAVFFLLFAALNERRGARERSGPPPAVAKTIVGASAILIMLSVFSPGGAIFIVLPATVPLLIWAVSSMWRPRA